MKNIIIKVLFIIMVMIAIYGVIKPLPKGVSVDGKIHEVSHADFLYDLTYEKDGAIIHEQRIFEKVFELINEAEEFIVIDMFLFNDDYDRKYQYPDLSSKLTNSLISQKEKYPDLQVTFITDEINTFYGAYQSKYLEKLKENGINVVITDLTQLKDSNPTHSAFWRSFLQWFDTSGNGWIRNPFSPDSPKVTLRSYLKLLNFKANHRKVIVTENKALITSANPHDASVYHSNIAFIFEGAIMDEIIASEKAIADFSEKDIPGYYNSTPISSGNMLVSLITEGQIRKHLLEEIIKTMPGDSIQIGMFYLSERNLIKELINASKRGVDVQIILDPNKDAFGLEKNGIPNRPVAAELIKKSKEGIKIRWYDTHGEQFHTKLIMINHKETSVIIGGSANLTRRNIGDYNLESNIKIVASNESEIVKDITQYFDRIWNNIDGNYTTDFDKYYDASFSKNILYRFQEWSGISTF